MEMCSITGGGTNGKLKKEKLERIGENARGIFDQEKEGKVERRIGGRSVRVYNRGWL